MYAYIYVIKCPDTLNVVYVGQTLNPKVRFCSHRTTNNPRTTIARFILKLRSENKMPVFEVIKRCLAKNRWDYELITIQKFARSGIYLLNNHMNLTYHKAIAMYLTPQIN